MKYHQKDIVEVNFLFPDGTYKPHPAIIISNDELQEDEDGLLYLVLISSNDTINPQYSYPNVRLLQVMLNVTFIAVLVPSRRNISMKLWIRPLRLFSKMIM